jgi:hypothetical protein
MCITEVTFTEPRGQATMQAQFGSSGGGLPRRPKLKSLGRFYLPCGGREPAFATYVTTVHPMEVLRFIGPIDMDGLLYCFVERAQTRRAGGRIYGW